MSKAGVSHWENDTHKPSIDQLKAICDELKVSADWLLELNQQSLSAEALAEARAFDALARRKRAPKRALSVFWLFIQHPNSALSHRVPEMDEL